MKLAVAYDVATSYSDAQLEVRRVDSDRGIARTFATAERAWFGEIFFDGAQIAEPPAPQLEPGYALVLDRVAHGRPQAHPRDAHVVIREYYDAAALLADAKRRSSSGEFESVIGIRVARRKPTAAPGWSAEARALFVETLAHPDDDAPRRVFADALDNRRGSFVVVQCDLARGDSSPAESRARRRTQREVLAKYGKQWSRLDGLAARCRFRRGFVEAAELLRDIIADDYTRIFDAAPHLDSIRLDWRPPAYVRGLADAAKRDGWWPRVRGLVIDAEQLGDHFAGMVQSLRALCVLGPKPDHAHALVSSGELAQLETLSVKGHYLGGDAIEALASAAPKLKVLSIATPAAPPGLPVPSTIRQLEAPASVAQLPRAIEKLALDGASSGAQLDNLMSLHSLDLWYSSCAELRELNLPALRELRVVTTADDALAIAKRFGAQLELLDLCDSPVDAVADELRALVAGDVWLGPRDPRPPLLATTYLPGEPMWDVGTVDLR